MRMVSPFIQPPFSPRNCEDAVAFVEGGNATLNKNRHSVNAREQAIKMRSFAFIAAPALNALLSKKACLPSFSARPAVKIVG
jgi:hypothetical protein